MSATAPTGSVFSRLRLWLGRLLLLLLAGYVVGRLWGHTDGIRAAMTPESLPWLCAAGLLLALNQLVMAYRQVLLLRHAGTTLAVGVAVRVTFAGLFANNFMPAGMGHDLTRMVYFRGQGGQTGASVGGLVLLDRFLGLMGLSVLALCSFTGLYLAAEMAIPGEAGRLLLAVTLAPLPLGLVILALRHETTYDALSRLAGKLWFGGALQRLLSAMRQFSSRKRVLLAALGLAAFGHLCTVAGVAVIAWGLYGVRAAIGSVFVSPLVFFASSVPVTPSNLGWTEAVAEAAWLVFGLHGGMFIFLVWRVVTMAVSLAGCASYLNLRGRAASAPEVP